MKKYVLAFFLFFVWQGASQILAQGHHITVKIKGLQDTTVILGYHFGDKLSVQDTLLLNSKGVGVLKGKEPLPGGMYLLFLPSRQYFDVLIADDQKFSIENSTEDFIENMKVTGSEDNTLYYSYLNYIQRKRKELTDIQEKIKTASASDKKALQNQLQAIDKEVRKYMKDLTVKHAGTFFGKYLKATLNPEIPDAPKDANGKVIDSRFQYKYYKKHFFDNIDFGDARMVRTYVLADKLKYYRTKMIYQDADTIKKEMDMLVEKSRANPKVFEYVLTKLVNDYAADSLMGMDAIYVHLGKKYFIHEATWADTADIKRLKKRISEIEPTLMGNYAPILNMELYNAETYPIFGDLIKFSRQISSRKKKIKEDASLEGKLQQEIADLELKVDSVNQILMTHPARQILPLSAVKAKYTILYFWDPDCSHCKKETPKLYEFYKTVRDKGVEVYAVFTQQKEKKWGDFIKKHKMTEWINVWDPYYQSNFRKTYNIYSTPRVFLLDKDKKILLNRINVEQVEEAINYYLKQDEKKNK